LRFAVLVFSVFMVFPLSAFPQQKTDTRKTQKKKPAAKKQDDWGRFNSTSKKDLDTADRKKAEKAAKK
jgi:hypothetical protein